MTVIRGWDELAGPPSVDLLRWTARVWGMHLARVYMGYAPGVYGPAETMLAGAGDRIRAAYVRLPRLEFWDAVHDGFAVRVSRSGRGGHRGR